MKFDLGVPNSMHVRAMVQPWEYALTGEDVLNAMALADRLGFHKCMLGEHFIIPNEHLDLSGAHYFHTAVALGVIGGATKKIRLAPSVTIIGLQNPIVQAKAWSTLDWLTGGRVEVLFGVGWLKEEFEMLGLNFHERGAMADEYIAAMIELWTKESPAFDGKYVKFSNAGFEPKPVQKPYPPIWFGGDAQPVLTRVSKFATGWSPFRTPPEKFPECIDTIKSHPSFKGDKLDVFFSLEMLNVGAHHEILDDPRAPGTRNKQQMIDQIGWLKELGVTETIVPLPPGVTGYAEYAERLEWVAKEIIPVFKEK